MAEFSKQYVVTLSYDKDSLAKGAERLKTALEYQIADQGIARNVRTVLAGNLGMGDHAPIIIVNPGYIIYANVTEDDISEIVEEHLVNNRPVGRLAVQTNALFNRFYRMFGDVNFFGKQMRITLRNCGIIDPENIDEYISLRGYEALAKVLTDMAPQDVVNEIKDSGLRGRGGAGFPTGLKWELTAKEQSDKKFVICNADEGDPGAFMDRSAIEGDPHTLLEGMAIGGYAIGAKQGYIYIRAEYPLAIRRLEKALADARSYGFLGDNILGTDFSFDIEIRLGAGAFVCGEETALIHSLEGQRGNPTPKPPYPSVEGAFKKPTLINNVETLANIPVIILDGAKWFSSIGTETSKGTKVFALAGNVRNSGLIEVPMGTTLREIVFDVGGGIQNNKAFKAVQTGGPSGGCLPARFLDTPIDYESLAQAGSIMGSGGMIVMDENTCMVNLSKFFLEFTCDESCGKCTPCREGLKRMYDIVDRITKGQGEMEDLDTLRNLGNVIKRTSLCGLGQSAPNPVLSTLNYFYDEYVAHIQKKECPAAVCSDLTGAPCQAACPLGTEAWRYIAHITEGDLDKAYIALRETNPLPSICARVCNHPCEQSCRAGRGGGEAIAIRVLKRFLTDNADRSVYTPERREIEGEPKQVAIIGAGPSGLTAAHYLSLAGHKVTIFDQEDKPGGMLRSAIPVYRLPRETLDKDIEALLDENVTFQGQQHFGTDVTVDGLFQDGYDAIYIAIGSHNSLKLYIDGEACDGVYPALSFLKAYNLRGEKLAKGHVGVIGGGNSAPDAARVALRQKGVESVTIFYRRTRAEMPAIPEEIDETQEEGVILSTLISPVRILQKDGHVTGVEFINNSLGDVDDSGRRRPIPIEGSEHIVPIDTLLVAISEKPEDIGFEAANIDLERWGTIKRDPDTLETSRPGVFAGGDVVRGPNTVIEAMADGKKAAVMIDRYLNGEELTRAPEIKLPEIYVPQPVVDDDDDEFQEVFRPKAQYLPLAERRYNFNEIELPLSIELARQEAGRCLRCDLEFTEHTHCVHDDNSDGAEEELF